MSQQQQIEEQKPQREVVFDETGQTVEVHEEPDPVAEAARAASGEGEAAEQEEQAPAAAKIRIGDQEFASQDEALAYAQRLQAESDAYQRGVSEALNFQRAQPPGVTPQQEQPAPQENIEELYTNPQEFLRRRDAQVEQRVLKTLDQRDSLRHQSNAIWREFTDRHPGLADFRSEVENFVNVNQRDVQGIISSKGQVAAYDFIATKLKSQFARYADAMKPTRELKNGGTQSTPAGKGSSVTQTKAPQKQLSMAEQMRSLRKSR